ncbi:uncharacterized protein LOC128893909 [Hylaeus anthracinus]|uniref:uncharacterized protein LOC128893909 n=1 Tax=Hylaeus anthracinus TaxID=313031 RepID=UPI0023B8A4EB|nr:uncharacterized protein LOC128893909 [Hylaeus anthracinus]
MASRCIDAAMKDNSEKWMLHGRLLLGQTLAKLGRLAEALDELQIAAKITEEEGDNPMLSYIRDLMDQVSVVLRRIENERRGIEKSKVTPATEREEDRDAKPSDQFISRTETVITTMFSQRRVITALRGGGSSSGTSVAADEEITMHSKGSTSLDEVKLDFKGSSGGLSRSTRNPRISRNRSKVASFSSSSSSSSSADDELAEEPDVDSVRGIVRDTKQNLEEESLIRSIDSKTSMNTVNTGATYVIDSEEDSVAKGESDNEVEPKTTSWRSDKGCEGAGENVGSSDKNAREGMLNAFRAIKELANKNEVELLDVLTDMLLTRDGKDRSRDLGNSGDAGGEKYENTRSCEDSQDKVAACHSLYKHSLPSSPRKRDVNEDFHGCEATSGSN